MALKSDDVWKIYRDVKVLEGVDPYDTRWPESLLTRWGASDLDSCLAELKSTIVFKHKSSHEMGILVQNNTTKRPLK